MGPSGGFFIKRRAGDCAETLCGGCEAPSDGRRVDRFASFRRGDGLGGGVGGAPVMDGGEDGRSAHVSNEFGTGAGGMGQVALRKGWLHGVQAETP